MSVAVHNPFAPPTEDPSDGTAQASGTATGVGGPGEIGAVPAPARRARRAPRPVPPRRPKPPAPPVPDAASVGVTALLVLALVAGWVLLQLVVVGGLAQARAQQVLHADLREQLASQIAPLGGAIDPGAPVALLSIPTLGLRQVVVEGTASGDTMAGPGPRRDTVLPGQEGIAILYGRSTAYGAPFRTITLLREGDGIQVTTAQGEFTYRVDGVRREGDPSPTALGDGEGRLTLVTAEGDGPLAAITPSRTVYVDATLAGEAAVGAGHVAAIPEAEKALAGDTGVVPFLALCLAGLLAAVAATTTAVVRGVPARAVWIIAVPVLVALAWASTDQALQLLPNLL
ncbi:MAG: sortase [Cellulomonadaceae bacterium]|nr:sortase [Cellulomonadaceae bacterium]